MKKFLKEAFLSVVVFFAFLMTVAYFSDDSGEIWRVLIDPWNWAIVAIVLAASGAYRFWRSRRESGEI